MARRKLTVAESLRIIKLFYSFLEIEGGAVMWTFWQRTPEEFAQACVDYDLAPLQPTPLTRNLAFLEAFITTIISYLSNGNLHTPTDAWIEDVQEGNKVAERNLT